MTDRMKRLLDPRPTLEETRQANKAKWTRAHTKARKRVDGTHREAFAADLRRQTLEQQIIEYQREMRANW